MRLVVLLFGFIGVVAVANGQVASFSVGPTKCLAENVDVTNTSTSADQYEWDLCGRDLETTPTISDNATIPGFLGGFGLKIIKDNSNYYVFALSYAGNVLFRLDYGNDLQNTPVANVLGNIDNKLSKPQSIELIKVNGNWFGFVGYDTGDHGIVRLDFGNSLENMPTATNIGTFGLTSNVWDLKVRKEGNVLILALLDTSGKLVRVKYDGAFTDTVPPTDIFVTTVPGASNALSFDITDEGSNKFVIVSSFNNSSLIKLDYGTTLLQDYIGNSSYTSPAISQPVRMKIINETGRRYVMVGNNDAGVGMKIIDYNNLSAAPSDVSTTLPQLFSVDYVRQNGKTFVMALGGSSVIKNLQFENTCGATTAFSTQASPTFNYTTAGAKSIALQATSSSTGFSTSAFGTTTVSSSTAPRIDFSSQNVCVQNDVFFTSDHDNDISTYSWSFGDAGTSPAENPTHQFNSTGTYTVKLNVTGTNSCKNNVSKPLAIYSIPAASFTLPNPTIVCTNQDYIFTNTSTFDAGSGITWKWDVDAVQAAVTKDLSTTFNSVKTYAVKLTAAIPGCSSNATQNFTTTEIGPSVDFTFTGQCEKTAVTFQDATIGTAQTYSWTFGDGGVSPATNPQHTYASTGTFTASLEVTNAAGCRNTKSKDLQMYTSPTPAFTIDLPPFSCSGNPSQFHDVTGSLSDSNIQGWDWTFGDSGTGTGKNPTHTYTNAGPYNVSLSVSTDKGCSGNATQPVTITQSPTASFDIDPACVNQPTKLKDTSTGGIASWQWKIGTVTYTTQNPTHTFTVPSNYSVQLNVTGQNNCVNTITKQVVVPVIASPNFEIANPCADQPTKFKDITSSTADPVVESNWTFNNNSHASGTEVEFAFADAGSFNALLQVRTQSGCVYSSSKNVTIYSSPVASFIVSDDSGPSPFTVAFTNTSSGAFSYQWNFKDGSAATSDISPSHTFSVLGDYPVDLVATNTDGCSKTATKIISVVDPKNDLALEDFTLVKPSGSNNYRGYVRVRNNGNYSIDGFYVTYGVGGGLLLKEAVVASLGKGEVGTFQLSNEFLSPGPSAYICAELDNDLNITDNKACETFEDLAIILGSYPNPADGYLNIESILPQAGLVHVRLFTSSGALAYDRSFDAGIGLSRLSLDIQNLSPGIYVAVITAGVTTSSHRILIAR